MAKAREAKEQKQKLILDLVQKTGYSKRVITSALKVGASEAQIMALQNEEALRALITNVDPRELANMPTADLKANAKPKTPAEPVNMKNKIAKLNIEISPQVALTWKRGDYEQSELDHYINRNGHIDRKYLVRVVITRKYVPNKGSKYETGFEIHYKE